MWLELILCDFYCREPEWSLVLTAAAPCPVILEPHCTEARVTYFIKEKRFAETVAETRSTVEGAQCWAGEPALPWLSCV